MTPSSLRNAWTSSALLLALAGLVSACGVQASGAIPCYGDSNCPATYPQCAGGGADAPGKCVEAQQQLPDGGFGTDGISLTVVGIAGHSQDDVVAGPVRAKVVANARAGVKTLVLKAGSSTLLPAADSAPPNYQFDIAAQAGAGDLPLQATLTTNDAVVHGSSVYKLHFDNQAPVLALADPVPAYARKGGMITIDVTSDKNLASVGGDVFLVAAPDLKVGTLAVVSGANQSFTLGYAVPADATAGLYQFIVSAKDTVGNAALPQTKQGTVIGPFAVNAVTVVSAAVEGLAPGTPAGKLGSTIAVKATLPPSVLVSAATFSLVDSAGHGRTFHGTYALTTDASSTTLQLSDAIVAGDADGLASVRVSVTDAAGNVATSAAPLIIDMQAPLLAGLAPDRALADFNGGPVVFTGRASKRIVEASFSLAAPQTGGGTCTCDGGSCAASTSAAPLVSCSVAVPAVAVDTTVTVAVTMKDLVGNVSLAAANSASFQDLQLPVANSLLASKTTIEQGLTTMLTANFAGGTGLITNDQDATTLPAISGAPVQVSPPVTTRYTLTVMNAVNSIASSHPQITITVNLVGLGGNLTFDEPVISGGRTAALNANIPTFSNVTSASLLVNGSPAVLAAGGNVQSSDLLAAAGKQLAIKPPSTATSAETSFAYTLSVQGAGNTTPVTSTATLRVVPVPTVGSSSFAIAPAAITGGANTNLTLSIPVIGGDTSTKSLTATLQFGGGTDALKPSTGAPYTSAELIAASGSALPVKFPPSVTTDDNKVIGYTLKVKNVATTPASATSNGSVTVYLQPSIDNASNTLSFVEPQIAGGRAAADTLHIPRLSAGTAGTAALQYFDSSAPGTLLPAVCAATSAACTSAQVILASQGSLGITPPSTAATDSKTFVYQLVLTNAAGASTAPAITGLAVIARPAITAQPQSITVLQGAAASFSVTANSTAGALSYQWQKSGVDLQDGGNLSGATTASLALTNAQAADAGSYSVVVSNTLNGFTTTTASAPATLTVNLGITITAQPVPTTVLQGATATFTVTAVNNNGNGALTYQWKKGGVALSNGGRISGSTSATLTITGATAGDADSYSVVISASLNSTTNTATSSPAALSVNLPPVINTQPIAQTVLQGTDATFIVVATNNNASGTLGYQWKKGTTALTDGGRVSGSSTATLTISGAQASDQGSYSVVVTASLNSTFQPVTSSAAALAVNLAPSINTQPVAATALQGATATFTVSAANNNTSGTLGYQWMKGSTALVNAGHISGATSATLSISNAAAADADSYTVVVSATLNSTVNSVTSSAAVLAVNLLPTITAQPVALTVAQGNDASFTVTATNNNASGTLGYLWKKGSSSLSNGGRISGATSATLTITGTVASDAANYSVVVTGLLNSTSAGVNSSPAALTINVPPTINTQPASVTVLAGASPVFTVAAVNNNGSGTLSYQWMKGGAPLTNGGRISGATSAALTITGAVAADADSYTVVVTATLNSIPSSVTSSAAVLTINQAPTITTQPAPLTAPQGTDATFTVVASNNNSSGTLGYQWMKGAANLTNGGRISGATSATLTITGAVAADADNYTVVVTASLNSTLAPVTSSAAALTVNLKPTITSQPAASTVVQGASASFTVTAANTNGATPLLYQWQKGGAPVADGGRISGASTATLTIANTMAADADNYTVVVTASLNSTNSAVTSSVAALAINQPPSITTQPQSSTVSEGAGASFTVVATNNNSGGSLSYQWQLNGSNVGTNSATLSLTNVQPSDAGNYSVVVTATLNATTTGVTSAVATLSVVLLPVFNGALSFTPNVMLGGTTTVGLLHFSLPGLSAGSASSVALTVGPSATAVTKSSGAAFVPADLGSAGNPFSVDPPSTTNTTAGTLTYSLTATNSANGTSSPNTDSLTVLRPRSSFSGGVQRVGASATLLPNGTVLIAGGGDHSKNTVCANAVQTVEIYDPATGALTQLADAAGTRLTVARCQHNAVLSGTHVYFFSGSASKNVDVFDTANNTFKTSSLPSLNTVRVTATVTLLGANAGSNSGKIVVAGGYTTGLTPLNSVELFAPSTGSSLSYSGVSLNGGNGRGDHTATVLGKWLCFEGGVTGGGVANNVDCLDTSSTKVTGGTGIAVVKSAPSSNATARWAHSAVALSNGTDILLMGGFDGSNTVLKTMQTYSINTTTGVVSAASAPLDMGAGRAYFPVLATRSTDKFVVFGGMTSQGTPDGGGTAIELIDATGALGASAYATPNLSVARLESAAVNLALPGASNFAFLIAGGDPAAGGASNGTVEVIIDP
jgi:hypothetical protein